MCAPNEESPAEAGPTGGVSGSVVVVDVVIQSAPDLPDVSLGAIPLVAGRLATIRLELAQHRHLGANQPQQTAKDGSGDADESASSF